MHLGEKNLTYSEESHLHVMSYTQFYCGKNINYFENRGTNFFRNGGTKIVNETKNGYQNFI